MKPKVAAATKNQIEVVDKQLAKGKDFFFPSFFNSSG